MKVRKLHTIETHDGGFLVLDHVASVDVRREWRSYAGSIEVVATTNTGVRIVCAEFPTLSSSPLSILSSRRRSATDQEKEAERMRERAAFNERSWQNAQAYAKELRWVIEEFRSQ